MFLFKKLIGPLLFPHSVFLALLAVGVLMLWFTSRRRLAKTLVTIAAAGFVVLSYPAMWSGLIGGMEARYPPLDVHRPDLSAIQWIVVLGGGGVVSDIPATSQLSSPSQARLLEGIRILNAIPQSKLLLSGDSDASIMQNAARILGVNPDRIMTENDSLDTAEQSQTIKKMLGQDQFVLVTSALHMPRAMALFAKQGLFPMAAPCDFYVKQHGGPYTAGTLLPTSAGGVKADSLFHEWLGIAWEKLRGQI